MYELEDFGSFYIGGRTIAVQNEPLKTVVRNPKVSLTIDPNGLYTIEAMYVQYFIPKAHQKTCVLIHGGGHTGAVWDKTPDGRLGWLQLLLQEKFAVYVVDTIERGRSAWCSLPNVWPGLPEQRTAETLWYAFRFGAKENFNNKIPYPEQRFPITYFHQLTKYDVPRWNCNAEKSAHALSQLLIEMNQACILIAHSQGADVAMQCYDRCASLVEKIILLEPAAFPNITNTGNTKLLCVLGDYLDITDFWIPIKKMTYDYIANLNQIGLSASVLNLPEKNIRGNSHMLMMDNNSHEILNLVNI